MEVLFMKKITITIENLENSAFQEGNLNFEIARILKKLAAKIENGNIPEKILDINGNKVGNIDVV
jgi:hypothetical protein